MLYTSELITTSSIDINDNISPIGRVSWFQGPSKMIIISLRNHWRRIFFGHFLLLYGQLTRNCTNKLHEELINQWRIQFCAFWRWLHVPSLIIFNMGTIIRRQGRVSAASVRTFVVIGVPSNKNLFRNQVIIRLYTSIIHLWSQNHFLYRYE